MTSGKTGGGLRDQVEGDDVGDRREEGADHAEHQHLLAERDETGVLGRHQLLLLCEGGRVTQDATFTSATRPGKGIRVTTIV